MNEFMNYTISFNNMFKTFKEYHARLVWGQATGLYPNLSPILVMLYKSPGSTAGIERNHKIGNLVLNQRRCRLLEMNAQRKVFVTHNFGQLDRKLTSKHSGEFEMDLKRFNDHK